MTEKLFKCSIQYQRQPEGIEPLQLHLELSLDIQVLGVFYKLLMLQIPGHKYNFYPL